MQVTSNRGNITQVHMNNPDLTLPDGRVAETLDRYELAHALIALGVEGVTVSTGKIEALHAYRNHLQDIKDTAVRTWSASGDAA